MPDRAEVYSAVPPSPRVYSVVVEVVDVVELVTIVTLAVLLLLLLLLACCSSSATIRWARRGTRTGSTCG